MSSRNDADIFQNYIRVLKFLFCESAYPVSALFREKEEGEKAIAAAKKGKVRRSLAPSENYYAAKKNRSHSDWRGLILTEEQQGVGRRGQTFDSRAKIASSRGRFDEHLGRRRVRTGAEVSNAFKSLFKLIMPI